MKNVLVLVLAGVSPDARLRPCLSYNDLALYDDTLVPYSLSVQSAAAMPNSSVEWLVMRTCVQNTLGDKVGCVTVLPGQPI